MRPGAGKGLIGMGKHKGQPRQNTGAGDGQPATEVSKDKDQHVGSLVQGEGFNSYGFDSYFYPGKATRPDA